MRTGPVRDAAVRVRTRLGPGVGGLTALATAGGVWLVSLLLFGTLADDVVEHNGVVGRDAGVLQFITVHRTASLVDMSKVAADVGSTWALIAIAAATGVWLWRRRLGWVVAVAPLVSLAVGGVCVAVMKSTISRPRPAVTLHLVSETDASFPSGHATDSAAVFVTIALLLVIFVVRRPLARAASVAAGLLAPGVIGLSRLELGVHWPTDVLAGWALGMCVALVVTAIAWLLAPSGPTTAGGPRLVGGSGSPPDRAPSVGDSGEVGAARAA